MNAQMKGLLVDANDSIVSELSLLCQERPTAVWDAATLLETFLSSDRFAGYINSELALIRSGPAYVPTSIMQGAVVLASCPSFSLSAVLSAPPHVSEITTLRSHPRNSLTYMFLSEECQLACFAQPDPEPNDVFDPGKLLRHTEDIISASPLVIEARAGYDLFSLTSEHSCPQLLVNLSSRPVQRFVWDYDARTLQPRRICAESLEASRIQYALKALADLPLDDDFSDETIRTLALEHPDHFVRWEAIRTLLIIDRPLGKTYLEKALSDDSYYIRKAASQTLRELRSLGD